MLYCSPVSAFLTLQLAEMARKWGISYSVLQNTEINFTLPPWVQASISGPINILFDVWLCILRSSGGWFSLDPQFHEFWMFNCSQNVCLRLLLFLWVKLAHLRNLILKGESAGTRQKAKAFRYDYWCLSASVFQSYWTDYSPSLQTIQQLVGIATSLSVYVTLAKACPQ